MGSKPWDFRYEIIRNCGGGKQDRTADLLHAMQALSQLSYTPVTLPQPKKTFYSILNFQALNYSVYIPDKPRRRNTFSLPSNSSTESSDGVCGVPRTTTRTGMAS